MMRKLLWVWVMCCLSGCNLTPQYTRPPAPVPEAWPAGPAYQAETAPEAPAPQDLPWRDFVKDARLQTVIDLALQNNRDLRVAALKAERARAMYRIQHAELYPVVQTDFSGGQKRVKLSNLPGLTTIESYGVNLGISSWEIDFFGRIRSLEKKALEEYFATAQARRNTQIVLISEVAEAYLTLAADQENLKLAQSTLETRQSAYEVIRRRSEVGLAPELDVQQAQTQVDTARGDIARYQGLIAQNENALNLLVGAPVPSHLFPKLLTDFPGFQDISAGTSSEVLLQRPDILEAESSLKGANANIGAARAAFFPRVSLVTTVGTASGDLTGLFQPGSLAWNFAPQIVLPIFDARTWSGLKVTKVDREMAVAQYEKAIQSAFREVADALASRSTLGERLAAQQSLVKASEKSCQLSKSRYEKGIDIYLNVLDTQRSLYAAQRDLIALRLAKLANQIRLYAVLGGGASPGSLPEGK